MEVVSPPHRPPTTEKRIHGDPNKRGKKQLWGWGAPEAQCARSATIWASGHTRDPYFEILGAPRGIMVTRSGGFEF